MADINKLKGDVKWWHDEIRNLEGKLKEAERMLTQRQRELEVAEQEEMARREEQKKK